MRLRAVRSTSCTTTSCSSPLSSATEKTAPPFCRSADDVLLQRGAPHRALVVPRADRTHGDDEGCLRHAEARVHGLRIEAISVERLDEFLDRCGADRFGAGERDLPGGEVDAFH